MLNVDLIIEAARLDSTPSLFFWLDINIFRDYYALDSSICLKLFRKLAPSYSFHNMVYVLASGAS